MLDERKTAILRAVVMEYIETAQPVGSGHIASAPGVSVSSATVRNEMAVLEMEGFLHQPHTSAGRVPTDKGYRFFVDHLSEPGQLDPGRRQQISDFFTKAHGALEQMLRDTSMLLSGLTSYAAVVIGPPMEAATVRSVQMVTLSSRVVMVVAVLSNGTIDDHSFELAEDADEHRIAAVSAHLAAHLVGRPLAGHRAVPPSGNDDVDALCALAVDVLATRGRRDDDHIFVGGASRMATAFDAVEVVRTVLQTLEQQFVVVGLLRDILDRGLSVAIGAEHGVEPLSACSVVVAPYVVEGDVSGTIAVLGPTRMNYPQALAAVEVVSKRLGARLSEG